MPIRHLVPAVLGVLLALVPSFAQAQVDFIRGDVNGDGVKDISDPILFLAHLFLVPSPPLPCDDAADTNDDELLELPDVITLLNHLFASTGPLPPPVDCGEDPGGSGLGCESSSCPPSGTFPMEWIHGAPNCGTDTNPPIQVHAYDPDTYILRQNKCVHFEAPFMYLFFGEDKVVLLDTGATFSAAQFPIQATVQGIIDQWLIDNGQASIDLIVTHTHGHGDHVAGDNQFVGQPNTTVVSASLGPMTSFFGITNWPTQIVDYDLGGGRVLDIIPVPGHHSAHIAFYDRQTDILVTGDTLYPGYLFVSSSSWSTFSASIQRLVDFSASNPIEWVLGTHVEMTDTPGVAYPYGTTYQPDEHVLQLELEHLLELHAAIQAMGGTPMSEVHDDFIITVF